MSTLERRLGRLEAVIAGSFTAEEYLALAASGHASESRLTAAGRALSDDELQRALGMLSAMIGGTQ